MLYLAEVKKTKGFMGVKTELKLIACERNDKSWSAVPGEEAIAVDDSGNFGDGALVIANLNNRQVQGPLEPASVRLLGVFQTFSRLLEKTKSQEEEIEQWKESLTIQGQELNRRQMELEAQLEQLEGSRGDFEGLDEQHHEIEQLRADAERLRQEYERKQAELEGAWEHLRGEQARLQEAQSESNGSGKLAPEQTEHLRHILEQFQSTIAPTQNIQERIQTALSHTNAQQEILRIHWQNLESERKSVQERQNALDAQSAGLDQQEQEIREKLKSIDDAHLQLRIQHEVLASKQESLQNLTESMQAQEDIQETLNRLVMGLNDGEGEQRVDINALETMPLGELEAIVEKLREELEKLVRFVNDQEEELTVQTETVNELQAQINQANEYDRIQLETDLKDEQERMGMLDETLVGQRRTLKEREGLFRQHLQVLKRRQGITDLGDVAPAVDLSPVVEQVSQLYQIQAAQKEHLDNVIDQLHKGINQMQGVLSEQESNINAQRVLLESQRRIYQEQRLETEQMSVRVSLYESLLQPIQEQLDGVSQPLRELEQLINQMATNRQQQQQLAGELESTLRGVMA